MVAALRRLITGGPAGPADPRRRARPRPAAATDGRRGAGWLSVVPALTLVLFLAPVLLGLVGTLAPALGYLPVLGGTTAGLAPVERLLAQPELPGAVRLTLVTGIGSTLLAVAAAIGLAAAFRDGPTERLLRRGLAPLLALPHAALAIGLAFLLAPSGLIVRSLSPWATGWERPPELPLVGDPIGIALILGLVVKEVPFLLLMILAALAQVPAERSLAVARTLGYGPIGGWLKTVLPQIWPQLRLPVYAVLAYSLSVVDMAIVLGPGTPPPLAVLLMRWFADPDLSMRFVAAAGAVLQLALVVLAIGVAYGLERLIAAFARRRLASGRRGGSGRGARIAAAVAGLGVFGLGLGALAALGLWSVAARWRYPDAWPQALSAGNWIGTLPDLAHPTLVTLGAGLASTALALGLVLGCLEHEDRTGHRPTRRALWLIYIPLLVPQIGFLFGIQVLLVVLRLDGSWVALVWSHLLFVLPYVFLALADPWRALDPRYARAAMCLGAGPARVFLRVKLPLLARPIATAAAIGFAVSVAQYLPTLFAGAGRLPTLTTEAVGLALGADRRVVGVWALVQALLPLAAFAAALALTRRPGGGGGRP